MFEDVNTVSIIRHLELNKIKLTFHAITLTTMSVILTQSVMCPVISHYCLVSFYVISFLKLTFELYT